MAKKVSKAKLAAAIRAAANASLAHPDAAEGGTRTAVGHAVAVRRGAWVPLGDELTGYELLATQSKHDIGQRHDNKDIAIRAVDPEKRPFRTSFGAVHVDSVARGAAERLDRGETAFPVQETPAEMVARAHRDLAPDKPLPEHVQRALDEERARRVK